jgi:murein DD-endopeptidase MepM/ murein hydrolase activator NlpD
MLVFRGTGYRKIEKPVEPLTQAVVPLPTQAGDVQKTELRPKLIVYSVLTGDRLEEIAEKYVIDVDTILGANPQINRDLIYPGQQLVILREKGVLHTVRDGQTLWSIARQYGVEWQKIQAANTDVDPDCLQPEYQLLVPGAKFKSDEDVSRGNFNPDFYWPARGVISSPYGFRWGRLHAGIDIAADSGDQIYAARDGRVSLAGWKEGYGLTVIIEHGRGWETLYGHASALYVADGDMVKSGQHIAAVGNTGNSTGPHLHFEVRQKGIPRNPLQFLP